MYPNEHYTSVPQTRPPTRPPPGRNRNTPGQRHHQHQPPTNTASTTPRITDNYPHHHQQRNPAAFYAAVVGCPCWVGGSDSGLLRPCLPGACCPRVMPAFACGQNCLHRGVLRLVPGWLWLKSSRLVPWRGRVGTAYPFGVSLCQVPCLAGRGLGPVTHRRGRWCQDSHPGWGVRARRHTPTTGGTGRAIWWCCGCGSRGVFGGWCSLCGDGAGLWERDRNGVGVAPGFHADDGVVWACLLWVLFGVFFGGVPSWVASGGKPHTVGAPARLV